MGVFDEVSLWMERPLGLSRWRSLGVQGLSVGRDSESTPV